MDGPLVPAGSESFSPDAEKAGKRRKCAPPFWTPQGGIRSQPSRQSKRVFTPKTISFSSASENQRFFVELLHSFCYAHFMQITVQIPDDLAQQPDPARTALEAFAIEGYRSGALSTSQTRLLLGFETRMELDGFLKEHQVWDRAYSIEDMERDRAGFEHSA
jgi:hypothetical protein